MIITNEILPPRILWSFYQRITVVVNLFSNGSNYYFGIEKVVIINENNLSQIFVKATMSKEYF